MHPGNAIMVSSDNPIYSCAEKLPNFVTPLLKIALGKFLSLWRLYWRDKVTIRLSNSSVQNTFTFLVLTLSSEDDDCSDDEESLLVLTLSSEDDDCSDDEESLYSGHRYDNDSDDEESEYGIHQHGMVRIETPSRNWLKYVVGCRILIFYL